MAELPQLTPGEFKQFQELIYSVSGIRVPDSKLSLLSNRVRRRLTSEGFESFCAYFNHLQSNTQTAELSAFLDAVTTNESYFFRTEKHFDWLRTDFVRDLVQIARAGNRDRHLRVWSAACSTGEEPYSISICLAENLLRLRDWRLEVLGTDISEEVLQFARAGRYKDRAMEHVDEKRRRRYFSELPDEPRWQVRPAIAERVRFERHNLMKPMSEGGFDCIFIRNVLIYFDRQSKEQVVDNLKSALAPGGYLVVGPSEGIFDMLTDLKKHSTFLYQN